MSTRTRSETSCRDTKSKDGTFSPHLNKATSERLTKYCKISEQNRTKFVEFCVNAQLDILEKEFLMSKSQEELIEMILSK